MPNSWCGIMRSNWPGMLKNMSTTWIDQWQPTAIESLTMNNQAEKI
jgi:hypothetical protein